MRVGLAEIGFSGDYKRRKIWENNFGSEILLGRIIIMHEDGRLERTTNTLTHNLPEVGSLCYKYLYPCIYHGNKARDLNSSKK